MDDKSKKTLGKLCNWLIDSFGLSWWLSDKESACSAGATGDTGLLLGLGRPPGGGHGNLLQYSCLDNPMDKGIWWATVHRISNSWIPLK